MATAITTESQRLFVAVPLPEPLKQMLGAWMKTVRTSLPFSKWTDSADLHVTLHFLGDTAVSRIPELKAALASAAGSGKVQPFRLSLQSMGTFGIPGQPKVLWAAIGGGVNQLHNLQHEIVVTMAPLGFPAEDRKYSPHLTVARKYTGKEAFTLPELPHPLEWLVDEIVLYRTHMHRNPMYEVAARFPIIKSLG